MTPTCPDLRILAGNRYRLRNGELDRPAYETDDPWELTCPGRSGFIAPHGPGLLVACTNSRVTTKRILALVHGSVVTQDGDDGQNVRFPVAAFETVAVILQLRKKRQLTDEQRQAQIHRLTPHRFVSSRSPDVPFDHADRDDTPQPASEPPNPTHPADGA